MRGMNRLAHLTQTVVADLDKQADQVADRIENARSRAGDAIGKFQAFAGSIEKTADDIEAALGQITNDPTRPSDGS